MDERSEYAYIYNDRMKFKVKNHARVGNVLEIRVKATVRKNGVIVSWFPAEYFDEGKGEWKKVEGRHEVNIASLRYPPEKGKGLTLVCSVGLNGILCLHDPEPTWELGPPALAVASAPSSEEEDND